MGGSAVNFLERKIEEELNVVESKRKRREKQFVTESINFLFCRIIHSTSVRNHEQMNDFQSRNYIEIELVVKILCLQVKTVFTDIKQN